MRNQSAESSILGESNETNQDFSWQFPASKDSIAIERTRLTKNSRSRVIPIQTSKNSYKEIIIQIESLKKYKDKQINFLTDHDIALWVRQIIKCENLECSLHSDSSIKVHFQPKKKKDKTLFLIQLAHLFIDTESMRYPGALVENQMALDLILEGELTWAEALNNIGDQNRFVPMVIKDAVQITRRLSTAFPRHSKYRNNYPGEPLPINQERLVEKFAKAEGMLSGYWVQKMILEKKNIQNIEYKTYTELVKNSIKEWYPGL